MTKHNSLRKTVENTIEKAKKIGKNATAGLALFAALTATTACDSKNKQDEAIKTTTEQANTPKQTIVQDSVQKKVAPVSEDPELENILDELDQNYEQELKDQEKAQTPREKRWISKETREGVIKEFRSFEKLLISFNDAPEWFWQDAEGLALVKKTIAEYLDFAQLVEQPVHPQAQKVIDKYNSETKK